MTEQRQEYLTAKLRGATDEYFYLYEDGDLVLDGTFTLKELEKIVAVLREAGVTDPGRQLRT